MMTMSVLWLQPSISDHKGRADVGLRAWVHLDKPRKIELVLFAKDPGDQQSERMMLVFPRGSEEVTAEDCQRGEAQLKFYLGSLHSPHLIS